ARAAAAAAAEQARLAEARARAVRDAAAKKAAQERGKKKPQKLASRGMGSSSVRHAAQPRYRADIVNRYADAVRYFNRRISAADARRIADMIITYSVRYGLDARLVMAVIAVESNFNPKAVSPVGAQGLGQLMPGTAADLGVGNAFDPAANLEGSARLLKTHIVNMSADGRPTDQAVRLALACYNAGVGAVKKYKGIPPYRETQAYVAKITRLYRQMCGYPD
ncbi:MAG TPA: lytic transglycosylase domain-containing protein, partial [Armatimonadota bacterium]|nr:lytic transglycosylase domain-containing protein [Armatimonadota bacterium]